MEKTELMIEYEIKIDSVVNWEANPIGYAKYLESELIKERAKPTITYQAVDTFQEIITAQCDEISALKEKANAYDRLMSGNPTPKEIANLLGMVIAQNPNNTWAAFNSMPNLSFFTRRWETADKKKGLDITHCHIRYNDAWGNSLTLPDGWEDK